METVLGQLGKKENIKTGLFDLLALSVIYLVPVFSHLFALPIYYIEPMRLMMVFAILFTSKRNALIIAFTMPLFSLLVSGHPIFYKALIMSAELAVNAGLFYMLREVFKNEFTVMALSIGISKLFYYVAKIVIVNMLLMSHEIIATPLWIQGLVLLGYSSIFLIKRNKEQEV